MAITTRWLTEDDAAEYLQVSVHTLRKWRLDEIGPFYHRMGNRMVRYTVDDLDEFVETGGMPPDNGF